MGKKRKPRLPNEDDTLSDIMFGSRAPDEETRIVREMFMCIVGRHGPKDGPGVYEALRLKGLDWRVVALEYLPEDHPSYQRIVESVMLNPPVVRAPPDAAG
jgi:hypothetical protein